MKESSINPDISKIRARIDEFVMRVRDDDVAGTILGGDSLPGTLVFESMLVAFHPRKVRHLNCEVRPKEEQVLKLFEEAMTRGQPLLVTLTRKAGLEVFKPLERLMRDRQIDVQKPYGWIVVDCHDDFRLLVHSKPGPFPFDDALDLRLNLDAEPTLSA